MNLCIVGYGYLGSHIGSVFLEEGYDIWAIKRKDITPSTDKRLHIVTTDLEKDAFPSLTTSLAAIMYCVSPDKPEDNAYKLAYSTLLQKTLAWHKSKHPHIPFILTTSTGIYNQNVGEMVREETALSIESNRAHILSQAEQLVQNSASNYYILRLAGIYGPDRLRMFKALNCEDLDSPETQAYLRTTLNLIHAEDTARLIKHLIETKTEKGIYNGVDSAPSRRSEIRQWILEHCPELFVEKTPSSPRMVKRSSQGGQKICSNQKILQTGFVFTYPDFRQGLTSIINNKACPGGQG